MFTGVYLRKSGTVLASHCPKCREKSYVFPPKLPFLPPLLLWLHEQWDPLFQLNWGQRAVRRSLLSHTEGNNTLTDNVTHKNVREDKEEGGSESWFSGERFTPRLRWGEVGHNICLANVSKLSVESQNITHTQWYKHTDSDTKYSQANEFHRSDYISSDASL